MEAPASNLQADRLAEHLSTYTEVANCYITESTRFNSFYSYPEDISLQVSHAADLEKTK